MKTRIVCLAPGRVPAGAALARTITDRSGHTLLAAGAPLDASVLDRLSRRGVEALCVEMPDQRDAGEIEKELREAEARVTHIFRGPGSATREMLRSLVLAFRQESLK